MAAGNTYTPIATTTISNSSTNDIIFSSISGSYTDLILIFNGGEDANVRELQLRVGNNSIDSGSNYSDTRLVGSGGAASSSRHSNATYIENVVGNEFCTAIYYFNNYSNTTTYKTILSRTAYASDRTSAYVGLWRSTSAINRIQLLCEGASTFISGSTFTLYGILEA